MLSCCIGMRILGSGRDEALVVMVPRPPHVCARMRSCVALDGILVGRRRERGRKMRSQEEDERGY